MSVKRRLDRVEHQLSAVELARQLDAAADWLVACSGGEWPTMRQQLEADALRVAQLHRRLGSWEAVEAVCAAEHGLTMDEVRAARARWEAACP